MHNPHDGLDSSNTSNHLKPSKHSFTPSRLPKPCFSYKRLTRGNTSLPCSKTFSVDANRHTTLSAKTNLLTASDHAGRVSISDSPSGMVRSASCITTTNPTDDLPESIAPSLTIAMTTNTLHTPSSCPSSSTQEPSLENATVNTLTPGEFMTTEGQSCISCLLETTPDLSDNQYNQLKWPTDRYKKKPRETPYHHGQCSIDSSQQGASTKLGNSTMSVFDEARSELSLLQKSVSTTSSDRRSHQPLEDSSSERNVQNLTTKFNFLSTNMTESMVIAQVLADDSLHSHSSSVSLNSDDLMLDTEIGLDAEDDDIVKDLYGSEKADPFLVETSETTSTTPTGNREKSTVANPESTTTDDNAPVVNRREDVDRNLLRRLRTCTRRPSRKSLGCRPMNNESNDLMTMSFFAPSIATNRGEVLPTRTSARENEWNVAETTPSIMSQSMHAAFGESRAPLLSGRPFPFLSPHSALMEEVDESALTVSHSNATSLYDQSSYDPTIMFFASDCRQMMQEMSRIKLSLLKLRRMLIEDDGHQPAFHKELSTVNNNKPSDVLVKNGSSLATSQSKTNEGEATSDKLPDLDQLNDESVIDSLSKGSLCQLVKYLRDERQQLKQKVSEQDSLIQLMQTQMNKYATVNGSPKPQKASTTRAGTRAHPALDAHQSPSGSAVPVVKSSPAAIIRRGRAASSSSAPSATPPTAMKLAPGRPFQTSSPQGLVRTTSTPRKFGATDASKLPRPPALSVHQSPCRTSTSSMERHIQSPFYKTHRNP